MKQAVLIVGHGSRDAAANSEFEGFVASYYAARPNLEIAHAYIELANPPLISTLLGLASRADHVVVVPLFLFAAGHVKNDIPLALARARREFPTVRFAAARDLGVHPNLVDVAFDRARSVAPQRSDKTALVVVGRGASDPDANGDFCKLVRLLGEGRDFSWVVPSFIGITRPLFEDAAELIARSRPDSMVVVPYFLFGGRLIAKLRDQVAAFSARYPWIRTELAPHLGEDARIFQLIDQRLQEALIGGLPLPCDTCQYRTPISGIENNVGGLRALLWSVRHGFTHTQAMPHRHAHRPLSKHVLVCANADCADGGSVALIESLRRLVKEVGREQDIRITQTSCMGRCGEGPTMVIYPDGIWYRAVRESDAEEVVREHLLGDRLVGRLVDNIMQ